MKEGKLSKVLSDFSPISVNEDACIAKKLVISEQNWGRGDSCFLALGAFDNSCLRKVHSLAKLTVEASVSPHLKVFKPLLVMLPLKGNAIPSV